MPASIPHTALVANGTNILLTLSPFAPAIVFLSEIFLDTHIVPGANFPNYLDNFPFATIDPETYSQWTWTGKKRLFVSTRPELALENKERSILATNKCKAITSVLRIVSTVRTEVLNGAILQETVYLQKAAQAKQFKEAGFPESDIAKYPYIAQFAQLEGISPRMATESILVKAAFDDELLLRSEYLRVKYSKKIKTAQTKAELDAIVYAIAHDNGVNALS